MANVKHIAFYTNVMTQWGRDLGPKVTEAQLALAHVFGKPGKQSLVVAMALRADGVTRGQMLGAAALFDGKPTPQLNHMRALVNAKLLTRQPVPGAYVLVKGPKADQYIDLHGAKAATAVEAKPAKKVGKPRKAKADKPVTVADIVQPADTVTVIADQLRTIRAGGRFGALLFLSLARSSSSRRSRQSSSSFWLIQKLIFIQVTQVIWTD